MEQRPLVRDRDRILDDQSAGRERGGNVDFAKRMTGNDARPAIPAQIVAKCVLPDPSGPTSAMARAGQSGQASINASAFSLDTPDRKSSRAKLSA